MKKILSFISATLSTFLLLGMLGNNISYAAPTFTQKSTTQYSKNVADAEIITATKWNSVVLDIANLISDIGGLKAYIDSNIVTYFVEVGGKLEYNTKNVKIGKNLNIGGTLTTGTLDIPVGGIPANVITTNHIKNGSITGNKFDPNINYGVDTTFRLTEDGINAYYSDGNVGIKINTPEEKLTVNEGYIKILGAGNGIIYPNLTKQTTATATATGNDVKITGDQLTIAGVKTYLNNILLKNGTNLYPYKINNAIGDIVQSTSGSYIEGNSTLKYTVNGTGKAEFDSDIKRTGNFTLKTTIAAGQSVYVLSQATTSTDLNALPKLKENTKYKFGVWMKTDFVGNDTGARVALVMTDAAGGNMQIASNANISYTTDWTYYEVVFTTNPGITMGHFEFKINGDMGPKTLVGSAWFDVNSLTLEEFTGTLQSANKITADPTLAGNSANTLVTEKAAKGYIDGTIGKADGICGNAITTWFWATPTKGLCLMGTESVPTQNSDKTWQWTCSGLNGGVTKTCNSGPCEPDYTPAKLTIKLANSVRTWSDGTVAQSCNLYKNTTNPNKSYTGDIGDGFYSIQPGNLTAPIKVWCDMTTDGGGWTRYFTCNSSATCSHAEWVKGAEIAMQLGINEWYINMWDSVTKNSETPQGDMPYHSNIFTLLSQYQGLGYSTFRDADNGTHPGGNLHNILSDTTSSSAVRLGRTSKSGVLFNNVSIGRTWGSHTNLIDFRGPHHATYSHIFMLDPSTSSNGPSNAGVIYYNTSIWQAGSVEFLTKGNLTEVINSTPVDKNYCATQGNPPLVQAGLDFFPGSKSLDTDKANKLNVMLGGKCGTLLYQKSTALGDSIKWHEMVDGKGPTITVIKGSLLTIAGYNSVSWVGNTAGAWTSSTTNFLANLTTNVKSVISAGSAANAAYGIASSGPVFGGGRDLLVSQGMDYLSAAQSTYPSHPFNGLSIGTTQEIETFKVVDCKSIPFDDSPSAGDVIIKNNAGVRQWSNGGVAISCDRYKNSGLSRFKYIGDIGDGTYRIKPYGTSTEINVYCDMTTAGGGWTKIYNDKNLQGTKGFITSGLGDYSTYTATNNNIPKDAYIALFRNSISPIRITTHSTLIVDYYIRFTNVEAQSDASLWSYMIQDGTNMSGYKIWMGSNGYSAGCYQVVGDYTYNGPGCSDIGSFDHTRAKSFGDIYDWCSTTAGGLREGYDNVSLMHANGNAGASCVALPVESGGNLWSLWIK